VADREFTAYYDHILNTYYLFQALNLKMKELHPLAPSHLLYHSTNLSGLRLNPAKRNVLPADKTQNDGPCLGDPIERNQLTESTDGINWHKCFLNRYFRS